jgi:hypothetical protein
VNKFNVGDIVHINDTEDWYGIATDVVGRNVYVQWFDKKYERNGWFFMYMLKKVS